MSLSMAEKRIRLLDLTKPELRDQAVAWGQPAYRGDQLYRWLHARLAADPAEMTDLPADLRRRLAEEAQVELLTPVAESHSRDGHTTKVLFRLHDGQLIETVLMRYERRNTVCISSQAGCAMACTFCATGQMGLQRNLTSGEIAAQVYHFERLLRRSEGPSPTPRHRSSAPAHRSPTRGRESHITNVVVMGMGEPLANYHNLWRALRTLTDPEGFGMGARRITVSTVGLVPAIDRFSQEDLQINLAVSLHAPNDALRSQLVPINLRYPIAELMAACRRYVERTHRRITFEYALMRGINDSVALAEELAALLQGLLCHVNLIPLNPVSGSPYQPSTRRDAEAFVEVLQRHGIPTTLRVRRGIDINAGCGQLRANVVQGRRIALVAAAPSAPAPALTQTAARSRPQENGGRE